MREWRGGGVVVTERWAWIDGRDGGQVARFGCKSRL